MRKAVCWYTHGNLATELYFSNLPRRSSKIEREGTGNMATNSVIAEKLLDKSKEAFLLAIEVYNKPSIRYRVEGFSFLSVTPGSLCSRLTSSIH